MLEEELVNNLTAGGAAITKNTISNTQQSNGLEFFRAYKVPLLKKACVQADSLCMAQRTSSPQSSMEVKTCFQAAFLLRVHNDFTALRGQRTGPCTVKS